MKWLALHFPDLPVECHSRALESPGPLALWTAGRQRRIFMCNNAAGQLGIVPGQSVAAALALVDDLRLLPYRAETEQAALEANAVWASRFSSHVSLAPPRALLLEAGRSLLLFDGMQGLLQTVRQEAARLGYRAHLCLAPTPEAALLLAGLNQDTVLEDAVRMRAALNPMPLSALPLTSLDLRALNDMGLRTLGDLLRLPRTGLARRFGPPLLDYLGRLLGQIPDPRPRFRSPDRFRARLELPSEVESAQALLFAARRLIVQLCGYLLGRGSGAQHLEWLLFHGGDRLSRLRLGLLRPGRDPEHMVELLRERLERFELTAPVREIGLRVDDVVAVGQENLELLADAGQHRVAAGRRLLERLRARLGVDAVTGLETVEDHRPELAWRYVPPGQGGAAAGNRRRPLWLLPEPRLLAQERGWPLHQGRRLELEPERERIESGWWDGGEVARDYFIGRVPGGERLWIYREVGGREQWFLHGWFA